MLSTRQGNIILEQLAVTVRKTLGEHIASNMTLDIQRKVPYELVYELTTKVLGRQTARDTHRYELKTPASWWQHLKRDHAPSWFLRRWPVRYDTSTLDATWTQYAAYPKADAGLPPARFGFPVTVEYAESKLDTALPYRRLADLPDDSDRPYMAKEQVAFLLASTEVVNACTTPGHSLAYLGVLHPRVFELVLDGLAELGVNPNELVRAQAGAE